MLPLLQKPRPKVATSSGVRPRSIRYGWLASSVSAKPRGLLGLIFLPSPVAFSWPPGAPRDASAGVDGPSGASSGGRPVLGLPSAFGGGCLIGKLEAADPGDQEPHLPERGFGAVLRLHPVHEVEHVAGVVAGVAVEHPLAEVDRAARVVVVVEGAADLGLVPLPDHGEAVVGEDGAEVRAALDVLEVDASCVGYGATAIINCFQQ
jgi:hypothetical protein